VSERAPDHGVQNFSSRKRIPSLAASRRILRPRVGGPQKNTSTFAGACCCAMACSSAPQSGCPLRVRPQAREEVLVTGAVRDLARELEGHRLGARTSAGHPDVHVEHASPVAAFELGEQRGEPLERVPVAVQPEEVGPLEHAGPLAASVRAQHDALEDARERRHPDACADEHGEAR